MIRRKRTITMVAFLISTIAAGAIMNASNLPMPSIPNTFAVGIGKLVTIVLPGNVHGQEEFYGFVIFWITAMIVLTTLYVMVQVLTRIMKRRKVSKPGRLIGIRK